MATAAEQKSPPAALRNRWGGIVAAIVVLGIVLMLPEPDGLPAAGKRMGAIFLVALILWATEAIPIAVTGLLTIVLQPLLRVAELSTAFTTFMSPVFFFVLAMFCLAEAFIRSGLHRRFSLWLLSRVGTESRRVILAFMVGTAAISTIMSDVPACAIFMGIALGLFERRDISPGSSFGKAMMIGIPIAALIGGIGTPAGSSINILGIHFIEQYGKVRVPFLHWMLIGVPMVLVLIPLAWRILVAFYPPEMESMGNLDEIAKERASLGKVTGAEKKVLTLLSGMLILWILSTWHPQFDVVLVALCGAVVMFLPGIHLLTWKQLEQGTSWESLVLIGAVTSLGAASVSTGLAKWLVNASMHGIANWNVIYIVAFISAFTVLLHLVVPIAPVVNAVLIPPIAILALEGGRNPALYALPVAFTASCAFLLPLDAVCLLTYSKGYYRMFDMLRPGIVISLGWVVLMTLLMVVLAPLLGIS